MSSESHNESLAGDGLPDPHQIPVTRRSVLSEGCGHISPIRQERAQTGVPDSRRRRGLARNQPAYPRPLFPASANRQREQAEKGIPVGQVVEAWAGRAYAHSKLLC